MQRLTSTSARSAGRRALYAIAAALCLATAGCLRGSGSPEAPEAQPCDKTVDPCDGPAPVVDRTRDGNAPVTSPPPGDPSSPTPAPPPSGTRPPAR